MARFILHVDEENHKIPQPVNSIGDEENKSHFYLHRRSSTALIKIHKE